MFFILGILFFLMAVVSYRDARCHHIAISSLIMSISILLYEAVDLGWLEVRDYQGLPLELYVYGGLSDYFVYSMFFLINLFSLFYVKLFMLRPVNSLSFSFANSGLPLGYSKYFLYLSLFILSLLFIHAVDISWARVWHNDLYLLLVSSQGAGMENPIALIVHNSLGFIGIFCAFLIFYVKRNSPLIAGVFILSTIYCLIIKTAQFSRWASLILVALLLGYLIFGGKSKIFILIVAFISLAFLSISLDGRMLPDQGLYGFFLAIDDFFVGDLLYVRSVNLLVNVFGGVFVTAQANLNDFEYPLLYQVLSFSFLPGAIDGWPDLLKYTGFVNQYVPYNVFSELRCFNNFMYGFFFLWYFFATTFTSYLYARGYKYLYMLMFVSYGMMSVFMHFYPIRNSIKFLMAALVLSCLVVVYKRVDFRKK